MDESVLDHYEKNLEAARDTPLVIAFEFIVNHFWEIVIWTFAIVISYKMFMRFFAATALAYYKSMFGYRRLLVSMRSHLEHDYGELWNKPEFCLAFLNLHDAYQNFLNVARTDHNGALRRDTRYEEFADITLGD